MHLTNPTHVLRTGERAGGRGCERGAGHRLEQRLEQGLEQGGERVRERRDWRGRGLAVLSVAVAVSVAGCGSTPGAPSSVRVERGSVARTVAATGTLQPITEQRMGFSRGGRLVALLVSVGQQVTAGQVLARLDDFTARQDLSEAQARMAREAAQLDRLMNGDKVDAAKDDAGHADDVLGAIRDRKDTISETNRRLIESAQQRLDQDRDALRAARRETQGDQDRCNRSLTGGSHRYGGYGDYLDAATRGNKGLLLESPLDPKSPSCTRSERGKNNLNYMQRRVQEDERAIVSVQRRLDVDEASERVSVENAKRDASAAGNAADIAQDEHPADIDEQQADVTMARTEVQRAQRALQETTLIAPVAGTVGAINGQVGEFIGSGSGSTALAPGGRTGLPDLGSGASSGSTDSSGGSDDLAAPPGAGSFLTLKNVNSFQIVVPFEESDAALVAPNQRVQITFDAVPGLERDGTLGSIAPTGAQIQDVNNYYATILLGQTDPRLKGGMTAQAKVIVGGVDNALVVPTAAIQRGGATGIVEVLQPDGTTRKVQVQLGMIGDSTTQVLDGLTEGQQIVVNPAT
jgi:HlyD family secretion protein